MRVCALELPARWGQRAAALADVGRALSEGPHVDLALLPEQALDGYVSPAGIFDLTRFAEPIDGPACHAMAALARTHGCHLAGPFVERAGSSCFNAMAVFGPDGARIAHYRKRHPWYPETWATPGDAPPPVFEVAGARITLAVCFDLHFLSDDAAGELGAADVLLFASAWVDDDGDARGELLPVLARRFEVAIVNANWGPGVPSVRGQGGSCVVGRDGAMLARSVPGQRALRIDAELP